ncbi:NAD(P)-dependent oxidoreductase [Rhodoferax sp.]|uniref:NAD(P)-dependent oxidoreductase n=2 Tax=Rhodoferax sp. TaxID=50421 RepID=UPI0027223F83|nr:NAD(P)-dependent oxidoreductase [Rhodoferax sp.]MDO9143777.1 NAD(P)-dependent oxidoreductase [Rhodoferax sp.]MDP1531023.1 NAD(P)-dependent oxidoreductase [Rhodoferax sp.]MDP1945040.1 NAD(P)-dependent oxidoreductase [Rhodoferax sp.]MDP2442356.1 NAD(P)-dependent oxidoreductase [Rhodoferax sp.]MDP3193086.1 NAD(P)-dependent oxidoreductase [Rhodoferax sp.]
MTPKIGFIGIGMMGHGMAKNLLAKGFALTFKVNRNRDNLADLIAAGAQEATTNAACAQASDIVFICVTGSPQVEQIVYGEQGLLDCGRAGLIVVDTSTAEPASSAKIRSDLAAKGIKLIDAPLARTPKEAEEGRLNIMVGAESEDFKTLEPVLRAFCENIFHVGPPGHGHVLKLVNNMMAMSFAASIAEAFAVAAKSGLDLNRLYDVVSVGGVNCGIFQMMATNTLKAGDLTGFKFGIANAQKDLRYYTHLAEMLPVSSFMGEAAHQSLVQAVNAGYGDKLIASLFEAQEKLNNVKIVPR